MHGSDFDLQGHRGARGLAPENTLPGFARALAIGVSTLELDCGMSADGVVVVCHDPTLHPDLTRLDGRWLAQRGPALYTLSYAELARYDVGRIRPDSDYARRFPEQRPVDGARIPRLSEVFELAAASSAQHVRFNIETKIDPTRPDLTPDPTSFARALIRDINAADLAARTTIQSFDWRTLAVVQREAPAIATVYLSAQQPGYDTIRPLRDRPSPWTNGLHFYDYLSVPKMVAAAGGQLWSPSHLDLDSATVADAQSLGLRVIPWTVNDPAEMNRLIGWGVDGLITDYPDRLRNVMAQRGMRLPPAIETALRLA